MSMNHAYFRSFSRFALKLSTAAFSLPPFWSFKGFKPSKARIRLVSSTEHDISPFSSVVIAFIPLDDSIALGIIWSRSCNALVVTLLCPESWVLQILRRTMRSQFESNQKADMKCVPQCYAWIPIGSLQWKLYRVESWDVETRNSTLKLRSSRVKIKNYPRLSGPAFSAFCVPSVSFQEEVTVSKIKITHESMYMKHRHFK